MPKLKKTLETILIKIKQFEVGFKKNINVFKYSFINTLEL